MRPLKGNGIDYFSFDVDFFRDEKIRRLLISSGGGGLLVYLEILCRAYEKGGYYLELTDSVAQDIAYELTGKQKMDEDTVWRLVDRIAEQRLLMRLRGGAAATAHPQERHVTLTSERMQKQWLAVCKRRKRVNVDPEIWMLSDAETREILGDASTLLFGVNVNNNPVNACNNSVNVDINPIKERERESKVKGQETAKDKPVLPPPPSVEDVERFCRDTGIRVDPKQFVAYNTARRWMLRGEPIADWKAVLKSWNTFEKEKRQVDPNGMSYDIDEAFRLALERTYGKEQGGNG